MKKLLFFAFALCFSAVASAQVYRCVNEKGRVIFSDTACQMNHKGEKIMAEKSPEEKQKALEQSQAQQEAQATAAPANPALRQPPAPRPTPEPTPEPTQPTAPTQKVPV